MSTRRNAGTHPHYSHSRDPNPVKGAWQPDEDARVIELVSKLGAKKWATIAPNYAYGTDAVDAFKEQLTALQPDVEFVEAQWPTLFKIDAPAMLKLFERSLAAKAAEDKVRV